MGKESWRPSRGPVMRVVHHDDRLVAIQRANALLMAWYDAPQPGHMLTVLRLMRETHEQSGARIGFMQFIVRGTPAFSEQVREEGVKMVVESTAHVAASAHVLEVPGLIGVATRAFLSTLLLAGRARAPARVFRGIDDATPWFLAQLAETGTRLTTRELRGLHDALKAIAPR